MRNEEFDTSLHKFYFKIEVLPQYNLRKENQQSNIVLLYGKIGEHSIALVTSLYVKW